MTDKKNWKTIGDNYHAAKFSDPYHDEQIDEMLSRDRQINPHWYDFMKALDTLGLSGDGVSAQRGATAPA